MTQLISAKKIQYMTNEDKENILTEFINKMFEDIKDVPPEIQEAVDEHFFDLLQIWRNLITLRTLRSALCSHPNPKRIIVDNFSDVYEWNAEEALFGNIVLFLEVVRQNNLWDKLEKLVG